MKKTSENSTAFNELFKGNFVQARGIFEKTLSQTGLDEHSVAVATHNLAQSYLMEGKLSEAETFFQKAIELYKKTVDQHSLAFCLSQYALILRHQLKREESEKLLVEVVKLSKNLGLKRRDLKNWFLKPYFHNLLRLYNARKEAEILKKKLEQNWILK